MQTGSRCQTHCITEYAVCYNQSLQIYVYILNIDTLNERLIPRFSGWMFDEQPEGMMLRDESFVFNIFIASFEECGE